MIPSNSKNKWSKIALIGITTRGAIFSLMGFLTILSVLQKNPSKKADSIGVLYFINNSPFGDLLLVLLGLGVMIYIIWRVKLTSSVNRSYSTFHKIRLKANHFGIALIYLFFLLIILNLLTGYLNVHNITELGISNYMKFWWAQSIIAIVGLGVFGKGIFQFYIAYSKIFLELVKRYSIPSSVKTIFIWFGRIGYSVRGLIFCVLGFLIFRTTYTFYLNPNVSVKEALDFISATFGEAILLFTGVGLLIFSLFVFLKANYRIIDANG